MNKLLTALSYMILLAIVGAVIGGGYLLYLAIGATIAAVPSVAWLVAGGAVLFAIVFVATGGAIALVRRWWRSSRYVRPTDGLFPLVDLGGGIFYNGNEPGAQSLAALAAGRRPTAAAVGRIIDGQYRTVNTPSDVPQIAEPAARFPARVEVYDAALPRALALPVGVDGDGQPVALPLRNLGNVLVGGLPGGGKSELLASMMAGLLRQDASGRTVQVAAIDTKLVSFGLLPNLAALYAPPALTLEDAHGLIAGLAAEVQRRFELLHAARVRSLEELENSTGERLPYLACFVDELADLSTDLDKARRDRFLALTQEIGRKGRAAGVALIMATQRPSADVIPSSLRNLAGAAVAFRVSRNHDSIAVLGEPGAETLPAVPGRCLVKHADVAQVQGYAAGLEGGRFDAFCAALPQVTTLQPLRTDGAILVNNWPTTGAVVPVAAVVDGCGPVVQRLEPGREPDPQLASTMRAWYHDGVSKTAICARTWGYKDGPTWSILDRVLAGEL
ncbi:MAG: FtsK/SpoIIIE domain-containing protein [Anaerolineae bacterium]